MNAPNDFKFPPLKDPSLFRTESYINGEWVAADSGLRFDVDNPADGSIVASVPDCGAVETRRAIEAADAALPAWRAMTAKQRAAILRRWYELMLLNADDLALILTTEQGKPLAEAKGEINYGASFIEWFAEEGKRIYGDVIPPHLADKRLDRSEAADRRHGRDHTVEFPQRDDHAQGRPRTRRRLHNGDQAGRADAAVRTGDGGACRTRGGAERRAECRHRRGAFITRHRPGTVRQPDGAQDYLHRLHRSRPHPDAAERGHDQESVAGAGRQCAIHRIRRCRSRRRG